MTSRRPSLSATLRLPPGPVDLAAVPPDSTPGFERRARSTARRRWPLWPTRSASCRSGCSRTGAPAGSRRILLVLQGMDTSGKGGVLRHVRRPSTRRACRRGRSRRPPRPSAVMTSSGGWSERCPGPGVIGIFDRSHYEDVLIARVHGPGPAGARSSGGTAPSTTSSRASSTQGAIVVKCMLHISADEQRERLLERLDDPTSTGSSTPATSTSGGSGRTTSTRTPIALERCSTDAAPWHVVPADRKWYRNWASRPLLLEALRALDPSGRRPTSTSRRSASGCARREDGSAVRASPGAV